AELEQVVAERTAELDAMTQADFDAESFTPAGQDTYGRFMQIRVFDCWIHEQDAREALGLPGHAAGHAVDVALDEHATALGFVVGKKAGATEGQSVRLQLTGETARTIDVRVDGRAQVVDALDAPTATITVPTLTWFRWVAGRRAADLTDPALQIEGDVDLAGSVLANAAYTI
ncbi:MAG TPA: maleylpyruvate isomerase N-terminal domain-containing protein, partial [Acidimicrobiales bacterium]|nr:maleylpyruvate isomerase N-terminal domain-containing protein [Acidimicrobiales bacterium]